MNNKTRKFLFLFFVLLFVVITPLISLYAAGYKFSLNGRILQKTGMLIIDSEPDKASISINGKPKINFTQRIKDKIFNDTTNQNILKTPAKIKGLIPGEYEIKLEKDGYWSWEKKLTIFPGSSTFAEDIVLFRNNLPSPINPIKINTLKQSPNKKYLAFSSVDKYNVFNTENEEILSYDKKENNNAINSSNILWLDNQKVFFDNQLFSVDYWDDPKDFSSSLKDVPLKNIQAKNNSTIYLLKNNNILELNLENEGIKTILNGKKIYDYLVKDGLIYTIEEVDSEIYLIVYDNQKIIRQINLKNDSNYNFVNPQSSFINIYNNKFKTLYLVDPLDYFGPLKETINNVENSFWVNEKNLVYYNDYEIWIYDTDQLSKTILTRISNKIKNCLWHPSNNYIIYSTADSIFTIELDNREKYNTNQLIKLQNIDHLKINNDGDNLYFYSEIGKQIGLFKLAI